MTKTGSGEALAVRRQTGRRVPQVAVVRRALGLTQEQFSERYRIPIGTLRDWEQGRKEPDQAAQAYLRVIATDPDAVTFALGVLPKSDRNQVHQAPDHYGVERVWFVYRQSEDLAYTGETIIPRVETEEDAIELAKQFALDHPGVRYGIGYWTPVQINTGIREFLAPEDGGFLESYEPA